MTIALCYTKAGCKTGFSLYKKLKELVGRSVRRCKLDGNITSPAKLVIRLGNARSNVREASNCITINTKEAVLNASSKSRMMRMLSSIEGVKTPSFAFISDGLNLDEYRDPDGFMFVRGSAGKVRYDNQIMAGDVYVSKPLAKKKREYRVHVFKGRVLAAYEKVPTGENTKLFNSKTCKFRRVNTELEGCKLSQDGIDMALKAVEGLGLDLAGVDICYTYKGGVKTFYVLEVNSSPGLNSININEYANIIRYLYQGVQV